YGGDLNGVSSLVNEQGFLPGPIDARVYENFVVPSGVQWYVTALFTNDVITLPPDAAIHSAVWEIRSGVSSGNGGTLLYSGTGTPTVTPTGRTAFNEFEDTVAVAVNFTLGPGTYWLSVVPVDFDPCEYYRFTSYETTTSGMNAVGGHIDAEAFINYPGAFDFAPTTL